MLANSLLNAAVQLIAAAAIAYAFGAPANRGTREPTN
jgi:hypothetical protein